MRAQAVEPCWEPMKVCLEEGEEPFTVRLSVEGSDWDGVMDDWMGEVMEGWWFTRNCQGIVING